MSKTKKNKVCILSTVHPAFDIRIFYKEARSLVDAGYDVTLFAQNDKEESVDGVKIVALPKPKNRFQRIVKLNFRVLKLALKENAYIYHFHDPEIVVIGICLKLLNKRVIYDVHEDTSKQILDKDWLGNKFKRKLVTCIANGIEQTGALLFDLVVAATPDIAKKFNRSKTILVRNLPLLGLIDTSKSLEIRKEKPIVIYTGDLASTRRIKELVQSMEFIKEKAELWLLGRWESKKFREECESLAGWKYTRYLGVKKPNEIYGFVKNADIGVHLVYPIERFMVGLPTKVFEYLACSIPVVLTNSPYWTKLFKKGVLFANSGEPKDIAEKIDFLLRDKDLRFRMGKAGRIFIEREYSWDTECKILIDSYNLLILSTKQYP